MASGPPAHNLEGYDEGLADRPLRVSSTVPCYNRDENLLDFIERAEEEVFGNPTLVPNIERDCNFATGEKHGLTGRWNSTGIRVPALNTESSHSNGDPDTYISTPRTFNEPQWPRWTDTDRMGFVGRSDVVRAGTQEPGGLAMGDFWRPNFL